MIMNKKNYVLRYPREIIFSCGAISDARKFLSDKSRIILLTGKSAIQTGLQKKLDLLLDGLNFLPLCGVVGDEAPLESVDFIVEKAKSFSANAIFAVGGGSIIDSAKAAAGVLTNGGEISDYFYKNAKIAKKGLFLIAAPTTAGTGAEITENAVLSDQKLLVKKSIRDKNLIPDIAIIDPELTYSCSPSVASDSASDALVQAVESYTSPESNTVSAALALRAIKLLFENIENAVEGQIFAKIAVAEGSLLSAMAFSQTGLGAVHGLAHPVGMKSGLPHGRVCGILMKKIFPENLKKVPNLYDEPASFCGCNSSSEFIEKLLNIAEKIKIPKKLNIQESDFDFILKNCRSRSMERNPCSYSDSELKNILYGLI